MASEIDRCYATQVKANNNLDVSSLVFRDWGKDRIKQCGCSPDAFIQMAMQLANYRVSCHSRLESIFYICRTKAVLPSPTKRPRLGFIAIHARKL